MYTVKYWAWYSQDHLSGDWEEVQFNFDSEDEAMDFAEKIVSNSQYKHVKVYNLIKDFDK